MAEITLADLIRSSHMEQSGEQQPASPAAADEISRQLAVLTPEERRQADEIKEQIDIRDSQMVMQYGSGARQNIADFSANILNSIRSKDSGYIGELMSELISNVESLDFSGLENGSGLFSLFRKAEAKIRRFTAQYEKLEVQVDRIEE